MFSWFWQWNKFENRSIFDEIKVYKTKGVGVFGPPCMSNNSSVAASKWAGLRAVIKSAFVHIALWLVHCPHQEVFSNCLIPLHDKSGRFRSDGTLFQNRGSVTLENAQAPKQMRVTLTLESQPSAVFWDGRRWRGSSHQPGSSTRCLTGSRCSWRKTDEMWSHRKAAASWINHGEGASSSRWCHSIQGGTKIVSQYRIINKSY